MADTAWAAGAPVAPALWAQIRVGTGVAHLLKGDLEGTAEQLAQLAVHPTDPLRQIRNAVQTATLKVTGREGHTEGPTQWAPHMTLACSETEQPAEPLITALGRELPGQEFTINAVTLVEQRGPNAVGTGTP
ncbi:2'-5' RNA ligase family protein [Actinomadura mexicana]|uniref:2'-5' RNA ligase family protein n=1 Tax=Actinomadura mexicana TaxID=134959 RepID=UPI000B78A159